MTSEGIIQKAFKPYLYRKTRRTEFEQLQQDLIAAISKDIPLSDNHVAIMRFLVGVPK